MADKVEVKFIVRKRFKYGDKWMNPGDTFVPAGGKFDDKIIRHLCRMDTDAFRPKERIGPQRHKQLSKMSERREARASKRAARQPHAKPQEIPAEVPNAD